MLLSQSPSIQRQSENVIDSRVAKQQRRIFRIETKEKRIHTCVTIILKIDNPFYFATRRANSIDAWILRKADKVNELSVVRPHGIVNYALLQNRPLLRFQIED